MTKYTIEAQKVAYTEWEWIYNGEALTNDWEVWDIVRKELKTEQWEVIVVSKYEHDGKMTTVRLTVTADPK